MSETRNFYVDSGWAMRWPTSNLAGLKVSAEIAENGDLVDLSLYDGNDRLIDRDDERVASLEAAELNAALLDYSYLPEWERAAREQGADAAKAAATWLIGEDWDVTGAGRVLQRMRDGDPAMDEHLPREPNLSGEMADDPTPTSLFADITAGSTGAELADDDGETISAVADAYELGVSETFSGACEAELEKYLAGEQCPRCESTDTHFSNTTREGNCHYCNACERHFQIL